MKLKSGLSMTALLLLVISASGCGGNSGVDNVAGNNSGATPPSPPPPPPPTGDDGSGGPPAPPLGAACGVVGGSSGGVGDGTRGGIWVSEPQHDTTERNVLLIAETGEFHLVVLPAYGYQQVFGTMQVDGPDMNSTDATWVWVDGLTWLETDFVPVSLWGTLVQQAGLSLGFQLPVAVDAPGILSPSLAACDTLYQRDSSLEILAGTYIDGNTMLAIDDQGEIFYQGSSCVGNGTAEVIDPDFNMYRIEIEVEGCTGNTVHAPGRLFAGLAYLGDSGDGATNDVIGFALSSASANDVLVWNQTAQE